MSASEIRKELITYEQELETQLAEVRNLQSKGTKASALRVRKNSLELAKQGKELRKLTISHIG